MAVVTDKNWQTTKPTIRERTKFIFNNDLFSDVKFVVRNSDGESELKQVIQAQKFVLSIGSPVFEAMFYGELAETRDSIELPDCEYESLLELLRFIYCDEVNLSGSNVMGVLYLAKKYMVPSLADKCSKYLKNHLDSSNVFIILQSAQKYEEKNLVDRCWEVIDEETEAVLKSDEFATLERPLLETLVERDTLDISEVKLFKGVVEWATKESEKRGIVADGQEKRRIIGERIVKALRFPVMKQEEFASVVVGSKILTHDEVADVMECFGAVQSSPVVFPVVERSGPPNKLVRCSRFRSLQFGWSNGSTRLHFLVDSKIKFHGVHLFGSKENSYTVTLKLLSGSTVLASTDGTFSSVLNVSAEYYGFDVLFAKPIPLIKGVVYSVKADINGPRSWYGINGRDLLVCSGVAFTLREQSVSLQTKTSIARGQFDEFIFSFRK